MAKKIAYTRKPSAGDPADAFVNAGSILAVTSTADQAMPMKRLTLDLPEPLHRRIKSKCAERGTKMIDEIRAILEKHFA